MTSRWMFLLKKNLAEYTFVYRYTYIFHLYVVSFDFIFQTTDVDKRSQVNRCKLQLSRSK